MTLARAHGSSLDRLRVHEEVENLESLGHPQTDSLAKFSGQVSSAVADLGGGRVAVLEAADLERFPALAFMPSLGWLVVHSQNAQGKLVGQSPTGMYAVAPLDIAFFIFCRFGQTAGAANIETVRTLFEHEFWRHRGIFIEGAGATAIVNLLAFAVSLYSMQVYDRVIPTQGYATLLVLTVGMGIVLILDLAIKISRTHVMDRAIIEIDRTLTRDIFRRLLNVRLDQMPASVGSLSAQLRSYETVRSFLSATTLYLLVDIPFALAFLALIAVIASPVVALVPLGFILVSVALGFSMRKSVNEHAAAGAAAGNRKTGLLVEAIEGAETIKSGSGQWRFLSKWMQVTDEALEHEVLLRRFSEQSAHMSGMLQQICYVGIVAFAAYLATTNHLTQGGIIACSILSGRAMAPISQIPGMVVQAGHAKSALAMLESVYRLKPDNAGVDRPIVPERLDGGYDLENVRFAYPNSPQALTIASLKIGPGERVGVIGPVGAGKSTLLRLLSGMYHPTEGRLRLNGIDISQLSRQFVAERVGYLQQEHRLFSGTLRENLLIGLPDPGDDVIRSAAALTGLAGVVSHHHLGLDLPIAEGGRGLSGGQRQLVAFTRLVLSNPDVWLLDEPTAAMDGTTEQQCIAVLKAQLKPGQSLVLVTHKLAILPGLVDRIIVVANQQVILDDKCEVVLRWLNDLNQPGPPLANDTPEAGAPYA